MDFIDRMAKAVILFGAITLLVTAILVAIPNNKKTSTQEMANVTVSITTLDRRSGGTGVVLNSKAAGSTILTNSHVCRLIGAQNGIVITDDGVSHAIISYKESKIHDLCLITVLDNLNRRTAVATKAPEPYEEASVAGHPALYPTIITKGHFSGKVTIPVMIGLRECTKEDIDGAVESNDMNTILMCLIGGGLPIIRTYESQVVSPTIMGGSSGSAVYNKDGEIAGLVFAGNGDIGYGFIVPYDYINIFLNAELPTLQDKVPNTLVDITRLR